MMKFLTALALSTGFLLARAPLAGALEITPVIIGNFAHYSITPNPPGTTLTSKLAPGVGALVEFPLGLISVQTGLIYTLKKFGSPDLSGGGIVAKDISLSQKYFELPVLVRYSPLPPLSVGVGGYTALAVGDINFSANVNGSDSSSAQSYSDGKAKRSDFGLEAAAGVKVPLAPALSVVGDVRYLFGLLNTDKSGSSVKTRDLQFLAGVSFDI